ncbi:lactonase family protein [Marinifilum fragile]|uniref:lactonase family protein n=1 Tax=Marinifilum fragile TaxID=570161 RepID=UPI0006D0A4CF|nr:lactonase family protein [Marinifilum fragile]
MNKSTIILVLISIFALSCNQSKEKKMTQAAYSIYIGTYTDTNSKGIYKIAMNKSGKFGELSLQAETKNPSFLCFANKGKNLLAINEINSLDGVGSVESYKIGDQLELISRKSSGGAHPCFVTEKEGIVLTANYTGGNTGLLRVDEKGNLSELMDVNQHKGSGTVEGRQDAPHAHSIWFHPNKDRVIAVDLGTNELWTSTIKDDKFDHTERIVMPEGSGPRHLAFHPNGKFIYVINELSNTITLLKGESLQTIDNVNTLPQAFEGSSFTADIHISSDGKFLYGSNRGHNSIVIYAVLEDGRLELIGHESTRGEHPRNFSLSPDEKFLLVANQNTNNLVCFKRNKETGLLTFIDETKAPKPVCVLFEK